MFSDRLKTVLHIIEANSSDIAKIMDCDRSNVSRFINGQRVPRREGGASHRLAGAICTAAEFNSRTEELCGIIGCENISAEDTRSKLLSWLFSDSDEAGAQTERSEKTTPFFCFGQRLNAVMELSQTSNTRLGRILSIDPSYISRFRNGFRSPKSNLKIMDGIASVLLDRIYEQELTRELGELIGAPSELPAEKEELFPVFYKWLYGVEKDNSHALENLMDRITDFSTQLKAPPVSKKDETPALRSVYRGINGLREAVFRFLNNVYENRPTEIYLYSDQDLEWMTGNEDYAEKWKAMMLNCIRNGTRVVIIHNIERGLDEMANAIQSWLPLYPSEMIRSFYCKRREDSRFSTTLFLNPGYSCVSGHNVKDSDSEYNIYRYDTDYELLEAHRSAFDSLLRESGELVKAYKALRLEKITLDSISGMNVLTGRLSFATIPEETLKKLLSHSEAPEKLKKTIMSFWKRQHEFYERCLSKYYIHECIPISPGELPLADIPGTTVRYTADEYKEHLSAVLELSKSCQSYRLYPLPKSSFENIRIRIMRDETVVSRLIPPHVTFTFEHPYMCGSFIAYGKRIKELYGTDKESTHALLTETINSIK